MPDHRDNAHRPAARPAAVAGIGGLRRAFVELRPAGTPSKKSDQPCWRCSDTASSLSSFSGCFGDRRSVGEISPSTTLETADGRSPLPARAKSKKRRKGEADDDTPTSRDSLRSARAALDRVEIPPAVLARIMPTLQPGSTLIISDLGKSIETGPGTDIVVQTRGEAEPARSTPNFVARKRGESIGYSESSYKPRRRERSGDWYRW